MTRSLNNEGPDLYSTNFKKISLKGYYMDKTMFIKDFLDDHERVSIIAGPRRFGKSLLLRMMETYFERNLVEKDCPWTYEYTDSSVYFKKYKIWSCGEKYTSEQGKYPVIYLDFDEFKPWNMDEALERTRKYLHEIFYKHGELGDSKLVDEEDLEVFKKFYSYEDAKSATRQEIVGALPVLSRMLYAHYGLEPIIFMDDFDSYLHGGYHYGFYKEAMELLEDIVNSALVYNDCYKFAVITTIVTVSMGELFGRLNNYRVYSVFDDKFSEYVGFTVEEFDKLLSDFSAEGKKGKMLSLYGGYRRGNTEIVNPTSAMGYVSRESYEHDTRFWFHTARGIECRHMLEVIPHDVRANLIKLMQGESVKVAVREDVPTDKLWDAQYVYSVLLMSGYLKFDLPYEEVKKRMAYGEKLALSIVNDEVMYIFRGELDGYLVGYFHMSDLFFNHERMAMGACTIVFYYIRHFISTAMQSDHFGETKEFYHKIMLGLFACMREVYRVTRDEDLKGDIYRMLMEPKGAEDEIPGLVIYYIICDDDADEFALRERAAGLLTGDDDIVEDMKSRGITSVAKVGIAFCGKKAEVDIEEVRYRGEKTISW